MSWRLLVAKKAQKQLKRMDRSQAALVVGWLEKNIDGCEDPRVHGKCLTGDRSGVWRYRVGDYRVLCDIQDDKAVVLAIEIGHRSSVYDSRN